jgi:hypothetical protein
MSKRDEWPLEQQRKHASRVLQQAGVRLMNLDGVMTVGIWSDLDSEDLRWSLAVYGSGDSPWKYLDGPGIPACYKLRKVPGDPIPQDILGAMLEVPEKPWEVRDRLLAALKEYHTHEEFMEAQRNRIFNEARAEQARKYAGMSVTEREQIARDAEQAEKQERVGKGRETRTVQRNWAAYERKRRDKTAGSSATAERWRKAHQDKHGHDNWLRCPDLKWNRSWEELSRVADEWIRQNPEWPEPKDDE